MAKENLYAVLLAGGKGTRLWPLSTTKRSKCFARIGDKRPLLWETIRRLRGLVERKNIIIVVEKAQEAFVRRIAKGIPRHNIIVEPFGRSTASAVGLAAIRLESEAVMAVLPADALIKEEEKFRETIRIAASFAENNENALLSVGIAPKEPSSAYGYIKLNRRITGKIYSVEKFTEKPNESLAALFIAAFLKRGNYLWNAGIFIFKAKTILQAIEKHAPILNRALRNIKSGKETIARSYSHMKNVSIDYQIMEKSKDLYCVKGDFSWRDLGNWKNLEELFKKDKYGNISYGKVILDDTQRSIIYNSTNDKMGVIGMRDAIIARTENGTLVASKKDAEKVKGLVSRLEQRK